MIVEKRHFPSILKENEKMYFRHIQAAIEAVDINASLVITNKSSGINFRISPSNTHSFNLLINQLNKINNSLGLQVEYAKSIKTSFNISFNIVL